MPIFVEIGPTNNKQITNKEIKQATYPDIDDVVVTRVIVVVVVVKLKS